MARRKKARNHAVPAAKLPSALERINHNAAGIDCGSDEHYVAVPDDGRVLDSAVRLAGGTRNPLLRGGSPSIQEHAGT